MFNWLETMERKYHYDKRKSKCDKRKKRNPYRHSSRRGYMLNGRNIQKKEENNQSDNN